MFKEDESNMIAEFQKNSRERIIVKFSEYKGSKLLDIRVHYDSSQGEKPVWSPSLKGISVPVALLPQLKEAIEKAYEMWRSMAEFV